MLSRLRLPHPIPISTRRTPISGLLSQLKHTARRDFTHHAPHLPSLPPEDTWPKHFPPRGAEISTIRPWISNLETQSKLLTQFGLDVDDGHPKTVVEIYPGPGFLTRALLTLPPSRLKKLIVVERFPTFTPYLKELAEADDRVVLIESSGYEWDAYTQIRQGGHLDHIQPVFDGSVHPELRFISQLPVSASTEQLISQWIRAIPVKAWLWAYGRVPLHLVIDQWLQHRMTAAVGQRFHGKLSVLTEATCEITNAEPSNILAPYDKHFYPQTRAIFAPTDESELDGDGDALVMPATPKPKPKRKSRAVEPMDPLSPEQTLRSRKVGHPMIACTVIPKPFGFEGSNEFIKGEEIDSWDFVLRNAFVQAKTPVKRAIASIAPGAASLLTKEPTKHIDPKKIVRELTTEEWNAILKAFDAWPFKPQTLILPEGGPVVGRGVLRDDDT